MTIDNNVGYKQREDGVGWCSLPVCVGDQPITMMPFFELLVLIALLHITRHITRDIIMHITMHINVHILLLFSFVTDH